MAPRSPLHPAVRRAIGTGSSCCRTRSPRRRAQEVLIRRPGRRLTLGERSRERSQGQERRCSTRSVGARSSSWALRRSSSSVPSACRRWPRTRPRRPQAGPRGDHRRPRAARRVTRRRLSELRDLDLRKYHPKTFIRNQFLGDDDSPSRRRPPAAVPRPGPATGPRRRRSTPTRPSGRPRSRSSRRRRLPRPASSGRACR